MSKKSSKKTRNLASPTAKKARHEEAEMLNLSSDIEEIIQIVHCNFNLGPMRSRYLSKNIFARMMVRSFVCYGFFNDIENGFDWETDIVLTPPVKACIINFFQSIDYHPCSPTSFMNILGNIISSMLIPRDKAVAIFLLMLNFFANRAIEGPNGELGIPGFSVMLNIAMKFFGECINGKQPSLLHFTQLLKVLQMKASETYEYFTSTLENMLYSTEIIKRFVFDEDDLSVADVQLIELADALKYLKPQLVGLQLDHLRASRSLLTAVLNRRQPIFDPKIPKNVIDTFKRVAKDINAKIVDRQGINNFLQLLLKDGDEEKYYWQINTSALYSKFDGAPLAVLNDPDIILKNFSTFGFDVNKFELEQKQSFLESLKFVTLDDLQKLENKAKSNEEDEDITMRSEDLNKTFDPAHEQALTEIRQQFADLFEKEKEKLRLKYQDEQSRLQNLYNEKEIALEKANEAKKLELLDLKEEFTEVKRAGYQQLNQERASLKASLLYLENEKTEWKREKTALMERQIKQLDAKKAEIEKATAKNEEATAAMNSLKSINVEEGLAAKDDLENMKREAETLKKEVESLVMEKDNLKKEIEQLRVEHEARVHENNGGSASEARVQEDNEGPASEARVQEDNEGPASVVQNDEVEIGETKKPKRQRKRHPAYDKDYVGYYGRTTFDNLDEAEKEARKILVFSGRSNDAADYCCSGRKEKKTEKGKGEYALCWNLYKCRSSPTKFCFHRSCYASRHGLEVEDLEANEKEMVKRRKEQKPFFCKDCLNNA